MGQTPRFQADKAPFRFEKKGFKMKKLIHHGVLVSALLIGASLPAVAQLTPSDTTPSDTTGETNQWSGHHMGHEHWKAMHEQMAAEIKAQDAELEQLLTQMTNAPAAQKLDAVSAVVSKLVEDRLAMHQKMESMHEPMHGTNQPTDQGTNTAPNL